MHGGDSLAEQVAYASATVCVCVYTRSHNQSDALLKKFQLSVICRTNALEFKLRS